MFISHQQQRPYCISLVRIRKLVGLCFVLLLIIYLVISLTILENSSTSTSTSKNNNHDNDGSNNSTETAETETDEVADATHPDDMNNDADFDETKN